MRPYRRSCRSCTNKNHLSINDDVYGRVCGYSLSCKIKFDDVKNVDLAVMAEIAEGCDSYENRMKKFVKNRKEAVR